MSEVRKVVLVPRFSTFAGAVDYRTAPIDVRDYSRAALVGWRSALGGTGSVLQLLLEESVDLLVWNEVVDSNIFLPTANAETTSDCQLEKPWLRAVVRLQGIEPVVTCWLVTNLTARDR